LLCWTDACHTGQPRSSPTTLRKTRHPTITPTQRLQKGRPTTSQGQANPFPHNRSHGTASLHIWDITGPSHSRHALVRLLFSPTTRRVCTHNEPRRSPIPTPRHSHTHKRQKAEPPTMHRSRPTSRQLHRSRIHHAEKRSTGRTRRPGLIRTSNLVPHCSLNQ